MGLEMLDEIEILQGSFTLIFVIIMIFIGLRISTKYFQYKLKELITVGLSLIFGSASWWGVSSSFLSIMILDTPLDPVFYLTIMNIFGPLGLICWIHAFSQLIYPETKKKILLIFSVICIIYETFLIIFLLINPEIIGTFSGVFNSDAGLFVSSYKIFAAFTVLITTFLIFKRSMKSGDLKIQWKGKFLLIGMVTSVIGALIDMVSPIIPLTIVIVRLVLIAGAILQYFGWLLPERVARWLIKD